MICLPIQIFIMQHLRKVNLNRPKISTMPRLKSETSEQLKLYKMVSDKQRVQQELKFMAERMEQLKQQLNHLDTQIEETERSIKNLRQSPPTPAQTQTYKKTNNNLTQSYHQTQESHNFETFYLDI